MNIKAEKNLLMINNKQVDFVYPIDKVLLFDSCLVVMLMEDNIPDNNIVAIDFNGNLLWNISDIIPLPYPEAYIYLRKAGSNLIESISFNGIKSLINIDTRKVLKKEITK